MRPLLEQIGEMDRRGGGTCRRRGVRSRLGGQSSRVRVAGVAWIAGIALLASASPAWAVWPQVWSSAPPGLPGPEYRILGFEAHEDVPLFERGRLSGNWGGWRDRLKDAGVEILGDYITEIAGNVTGGKARGITYTHNVGVWLNFDLGKLVGWAGGKFHVSASDRAGTSLSERFIGNQFAVQQIFGGQTIRLISLAIEQELFDGKLDLIAGRINWGDDFLQSPLYCQFQNVGFCGNPVSVPVDVNLSTYPNTAWGIRARIEILDELHAKLGVYNTVQNFRANEFHGVDFSIRHNSGVGVAWELGWQPSFRSASGPLRGHYKFGGYVDTEPLLQFRTGLMRSGTYGVYAAFDQKLLHEPGATEPQGLHAFVAGTYAPPELARIEWYFVAGLVYEGLIPGREHDVTGLAMLYGNYSSALQASQRVSGQPVQEYETVLELNYEFSPVQWFQVQPDIQYVIRPGGTGDIGDALVFALQINVPI